MYRRAPVSFGVVSHRFHDLLFDHEFQRTLLSLPSEGSGSDESRGWRFLNKGDRISQLRQAIVLAVRVVAVTHW